MEVNANKIWKHIDEVINIRRWKEENLLKYEQIEIEKKKLRVDFKQMKE